MGFEIGRGTNASHWLSQSKARGEERRRYFTRDDVELLAGLGFDHIRIPVDEEQLWAEDGAADEEAFGLLDSALDWCASCGLRAVVDLHILRSHHFNAKEKALWTDAAAEERFYDCWRELSRRLEGRSVDRVAYELLNEAVADDPLDWNRVAGGAIRALRELEPERVIVLGSNLWNSVDTFDKLAVPEDDRLVLTFHSYTPFLLTHYRAGWTSIGAYEGPVRYPGRTVADADLKGLAPGLRAEVEKHNGFYARAALADLLAKPTALAERTGLPLYCGEWGCIRAAPRGDRLRFYGDFVRVLEDRGIAWATWDYKGGFGLADRDGTLDTTLDTDLVKALLG